MVSRSLSLIRAAIQAICHARMRGTFPCDCIYLCCAFLAVQQGISASLGERLYVSIEIPQQGLFRTSWQPW
ncbi:hypothetical protein [Caudoviricetes sp.]|nr:hypothetical protein [Caudoviricetes sp.]